MQLTLMNLNGVIAPSVFREFDNTVFGLHERHLVHRVRTVGIAVQSVHRLLVVKTDDATGLSFGYVESRMTAYLEMNLLFIRVVNVPDDTYLITVKHVADAEGEVVRIDFLCLFGGFKGEGNLPVVLSDQFELCITGETMTGQMILLSIYSISLTVDGAYDREKYR